MSNDIPTAEDLEEMSIAWAYDLAQAVQETDYGDPAKAYSHRSGVIEWSAALAHKVASRRLRRQGMGLHPALAVGPEYVADVQGEALLEASLQREDNQL